MGLKGPHFGTQGPTFRVQSVTVKDDKSMGTNRKLTCSLNKLILSILQSNLRPKFQRMKLHSPSFQITKGNDSKTNLS